MERQDLQAMLRFVFDACNGVTYTLFSPLDIQKGFANKGEGVRL